MRMKSVALSCPKEALLEENKEEGGGGTSSSYLPLLPAPTSAVAVRTSMEKTQNRISRPKSRGMRTGAEEQVGRHASFSIRRRCDASVRHQTAPLPPLFPIHGEKKMKRLSIALRGERGEVRRLSSEYGMSRAK
jgi:hypothetical protein